MPDKYCQTTSIDDVYSSMIVKYNVGTRVCYFKINKDDILPTNAVKNTHLTKTLCRHHLDNLISITEADLFDRTYMFTNWNVSNCIRGCNCNYIHLKPNVKLNLINVI